ncbi:MAG: CopG family transcriptional regulator [bacterium]
MCPVTAVAPKRATIYFRPELHKALRLKAVETDSSISDVVNEAVTLALREDMEDLDAMRACEGEPTMTLEAMLKELRRHGKL